MNEEDAVERPHDSAQPLIVWFPGVGWDEVRGTDRRLVEELSQFARILWCDPPAGFWQRKYAWGGGLVDTPHPNVVRVHVPTLPWCTRPVARGATELLARLAIRRVLRSTPVTPVAQVVASPFRVFMPGVRGTKVYFQTDDWVEGAPLMGCSTEWVTRLRQSNVSHADLLCAVTDYLLDETSHDHGPDPATGPRRAVLANGCVLPSEEAPTRQRERDPVAGMVGQLNERLDLDVLEGLIERDIPVRVIGPRADRDPDFGRRLDVLLSARTVDYLGLLPAEDIPHHLGQLGMGITPYTRTRFNRASFPLKTLEYLASGLEVVSTDLPAVTWLGTPHVVVGNSPEDFAARTMAAIDRRHDGEASAQRRAVASQHTWSTRAVEFLTLTGLDVSA